MIIMFLLIYLSVSDPLDNDRESWVGNSRSESSGRGSSRDRYNFNNSSHSFEDLRFDMRGAGAAASSRHPHHHHSSQGSVKSLVSRVIDMRSYTFTYVLISYIHICIIFIYISMSIYLFLCYITLIRIV